MSDKQSSLALRLPQAPLPTLDGIDIRTLDVRPFIKFEPNTEGGYWQVCGGFTRRYHQIGLSVGVIHIPGGRAHVHVLRFADGKFDTFHAMDLFPYRPEPLDLQLDDL
jgi:hypothetical protein